MLRQRYRVFVDMDVSVLPITQERIRRRRERWLRDHAGALLHWPMSLPDERSLAPQRALQKELLASPVTSQRRMEYQAFLEVRDGDALEDQPIDFDVDEFLEPFVERLPTPARDRFRQAFSNFSECDLLLDEFFFCFETVVVHTDIKPVHHPERSSRAGEELLEQRRFRITVDVDTKVHDASRERIAARQAERALQHAADDLPELPYERPPPLQEAELRFVQELVDLLRRHPHALDQYLRREVLLDLRDGYLEGHGPEGWGDIHALVDRLPLGHRGWFRAAAAQNMFYESTEEFESSFEAELAGLAIFEVPE